MGAKTTNAKAKTPGLQPETLKTQKTKRRGSSTKKPKKADIEVQQAQPQVFNAPEADDDVPDVEYAPPKPKGISKFAPLYNFGLLMMLICVKIELPDDPEDITYDTTYPQFKGRNIARGWEKIYYHGDVGEDGLTDRQRKFEQASVAYDKMVDEMIQKQIDDIKLEDLFSPDELDVTQQTGSEQQPRKPEQIQSKRSALPQGATTVKARHAAAALSRPGSSTAVRSDATRPSSAAAKSRSISSVLPTRKNTATTQSTRLTSRHATAAASSRTTVGYSKGRTVSSTLQNKQPSIGTKPSQQQTILAPETYVQLYGMPPIDSEMWVRCKDAGCLPEPELSPSYEDGVASSLFEEDEETQNFQLTL